MKPLFRTPAVQWLLALILTGYLKFCFATLRWRREGEVDADAARRAGKGVIVLFWHSRLALAPAIWPLNDPSIPEPRALISLSPDGEFIARTVAWLGFPAIRGSSIKETARDKKKGGANAFRQSLAWIRRGGALAITPDGPRGPAEQMAEGAVRLAQLTGAPVILAGLACTPGIRLGSWDRGVLPVPFARGALVWTGPLNAPRHLDEEGVAALCGEWGRTLSEVTERAEAQVL